MSTGTIQMIGVIACIALIIFFMRWMTRRIIRLTLEEEGFETSSVFTNTGGKQTLTATNEHNDILVARIDKEPEDLTVHIKSALIPITWEEYHWLELSDGTHVQAKAI